MRLGVIWMLTPDDTRTDGNKTEYLNQPEQYRKADPELFDALRACVLEDGQRDVSQAQSFLPNATFFSRLIPDVLETRKRTVRDAQEAVIDTELVFFDPDNGIEIPSCAKGKRNSSKFVYWDEVYSTYQNGHSVLVYQHFPRAAREEYVQQRLEEFSSRLHDATVMSFCTPHVGFFLAAKPDHMPHIQTRLPRLSQLWKDELVRVG
jgi:hypothetical protein